MKNREENETSLFACPSCGMDVNEDAKECPGCNAQFEEDGGTQSIPRMKEDQEKEPSKEEQNAYPPPPDWVDKEKEYSMAQAKVEDSNTPMSDSKEKKEDMPLGIREFNKKVINEESKEEKEGIPEPETESKQDEPMEENNPNPEPASPIDGETDDSESMHELKVLDDKISLHNELLREENLPENKVMAALNEYNTNRRKRYFTGTLFIGLGVVLFVLLWLVVVYDVLVHDTQAWFGTHIILILVVAGIFFTFGLYMILTYPKSSLIEILAYMTEVKHKRKISEH
jgi:hypothetical protein